MIGVEPIFFNEQEYKSFVWNIGKKCNYSCFYCRDYLHSTVEDFLPLDLMKATVDKICSKFKDSKIRIWFTGGEPTLNKDFLNILNYIKETYGEHVNVGLTTNGTNTVEYYKKVIEYANSISFSCHFQFVKPKELLEKIKQVQKHADELGNTEGYQGKFMSLSTNVMMETKHWDDIKEYLHLCKKEGVHYDMLIIHGGYEQYTEEQKKFMAFGEEEITTNTYNDIRIYQNGSDKPTEYSSSHLSVDGNNIFTGWKCEIGMNSFLISSSGDVYRGACFVGGSLGNIYKGDFEVPTEPIVCDACICNDIADLKISKYKDKEQFEQTRNKNLICDVVHMYAADTCVDEEE